MTVPIAPAAEPAADAHRRRRDRAAAKTVRAGLVSRAVAVGIRLVTIPLSLALLGADRYGLWLTVGSLLSWLGLSDLGLAGGLLNTVGHAYGRDDWPAIRRHVSTAFFTYAILSLAVAALVAGFSLWPGLPGLLGISGRPGLLADARLLVLICGLAFSASFSLNAVSPLSTALQEGYLAAYFQVSATVVSCAVLALLVWRGSSLAQFAIAMAVPPLVASAGLAAYLFFVRHPRLRPRPRDWSLASFRALMGFGAPMLVVQLGDFGILWSTNLVISNRLGPGSVPGFAVPASAFMVFSGLAYGLVSPYLPAYAEAQARGDWQWIRQTAFRRLAITVGLMLAAGSGMAVLGRTAVRLWTAGRVVPEPRLLLAMAAYFVLMVCATTNGVLLMGLGRVKTKAAIHLSVAVVFVAGSWLLLPHLGLLAVPLAGIAGYLIDFATSLPLALLHIRKRAAARLAEQ